jgi:hypothetical protein
MRDNPQAAQFAELVKLHLQGRRFLDRDKELKLLEEGVMRYNLTAAEASGALRGSAEEAGVANQAELDRSTLQLLKTLGDKRGRVTRQDFGKVAAFYRGRAGSAMSEETAKRQVKRLMLENDIAARRAGRIIPTRRWYRMIEG